MRNGIFQLVRPKNEYCMNYAEGCPEREALLAEVERQAALTVEIPMIIGGKEVWPERTIDVAEPQRHANVIAKLHIGGEKELKEAIEASQKAAKEWAATPWEDRAAIFLKAADLLSGPCRNQVLAATMLGQSKSGDRYRGAL